MDICYLTMISMSPTQHAIEALGTSLFTTTQTFEITNNDLHVLLFFQQPGFKKPMKKERKNGQIKNQINVVLFSI